MLHVLGLSLGVVGGLHVRLEEARVGDGLAARAEVALLARTGHDPNAHRHRHADRVGHLGGDGAAPDQFVELVLLGGQFAGHLARGAERVTGRTDRLVRLLSVLYLAGVLARLRRHEPVPEQLADLGPGGGEGRLGEVHRVGTHIGDVAALVQPLGGTHGLGGRVAQLAGRLLLQGRGDERRVRPPPVWLLLDPDDLERAICQPRGEAARTIAAEMHHVGARAHRAGGGIEVLAGGDPIAVQCDQRGGEGTGAFDHLVRRDREDRPDVPVLGRPEAHPLAFPLHHDAGGHGLHPARRELRHDLLPQDRGHLVAVQPVQDATGLLCLDQVLVDLARVGHGLLDRRAGDLVEDHPPDRHLGLEGLHQVPGDGLALAVLVRGQQEFVGVLEESLELGHLLGAVRTHHVQRREVVVDVDAEPGPRFALVLLRDVGRVARQIADMAIAGLDHVPGAKVPRDRLRLRGRLDDHQASRLGVRHPAPSRSLFVRLPTRRRRHRRLTVVKPYTPAPARLSELRADGQDSRATN